MPTSFKTDLLTKQMQSKKLAINKLGMNLIPRERIYCTVLIKCTSNEQNVSTRCLKAKLDTVDTVDRQIDR